MPRVVGPRIAASTTHPPTPIAPQARHLVTGRTAVQPSALHLQLHRRTSPRTRPDRPHPLAKPRPVRRLIRRADELLHVHKLMHQHLVAQVEPRAFHGGIAGRPIQQTGNSHHKGRPVRIRTDRPKLPHGGGWQELTFASGNLLPKSSRLNASARTCNEATRAASGLLMSVRRRTRIRCRISQPPAVAPVPGGRPPAHSRPPTSRRPTADQHPRRVPAAPQRRPPLLGQRCRQPFGACSAATRAARARPTRRPPSGCARSQNRPHPTAGKPPRPQSPRVRPVA